jgi:hypothetical protein
MPLMLSMPPERASRIYMHPLHQETVGTLTTLITSLRQCRSHADFFEFQQDLLERVLAVQGHRGECRRVAALLRQGKKLPAGAPELRSTEPTADPDSWELEADVCERVDRQLRSTADALAWRAFSHNRAVIVGLSRNQHPGPMVNKEGLAAERAFVIEQWRENRHFALLHDLTSCLSIGDATLFKQVGTEYEAYLHEIKSDSGRKVSRQQRRKRMAEEAIRSGGPLPGKLAGRLVQLDIPYKTHLELLRTAFELAHERGIQGMKVPGGRSLLASDIVRGYELWPEPEFLHRTALAHRQATKRAGILNRGHLVTMRTDDSVARSPTSPPWAIYPLPPTVCARLITDYALFIVTMASEPLLEALEDAGLSGEWVLPPNQKVVEQDEVVVRIHRRAGALELRWAEVQRRLLLELADLPTWAASVAELSERTDIGPHPWPLFRDEHKVWR